MKTWQYLIVFLALAACAAAATDFTSTLSAGKTTIYPDEIAYYTVSITNTQNNSDLFTVSTSDYDWILDMVDQVGEIQPGATKDQLVGIIPKTSAALGASIVRIKVRSANTNEFDELNAVVTVVPINGSNRTYTANIFMNAQTIPDVDPRQGLTVSVYMRNRNARNYEKLLVLMQSDLFNKSYTTSLGPIGDSGEKTNQITILLDPKTPPGTHPLTIDVVVDNTTANEYKTQYTVKAYQDVKTTETSSTTFFKTVTVYTVVNNGNTQQTDTVLHPTNILKRLFTTATSQYTVQPSSQGKDLSFSVALDPQQQTEITVTENYRLLFILAVLVIVSIVSYYLFRSPVVLRKEAAIVGSSTDGVSEMKMRLFIKNRSAKPITGIHIIDRVTSMADVVKEASLGTLQPTKVLKKKGHGTLVRWDIDTLEAFEERIITYRVKTELKLIGDVYLPAVKAKFDQSGRERTAYSNEVNIPRDS